MEEDVSLNKDLGFYPVGHGKMGSNTDPSAHLRKIIMVGTENGLERKME